ncbi:MAG: hypothetical protein QF464_17870, partial [Myxococcota bacterium]|nr:hypothetical protein [Myxococcota bacterium]
VGGRGKSANTYVTRDGLLHLAHKSQQLDGVSVLDEYDTDDEWCAVVEVYRKDMSHPFRFRGRYSKQGQNRQYGPEMAVKCAEVMALRRAFDVALPTVEEQWDRVGDVVALQEHHVPKEIPEEPRQRGTTQAQREMIKARLNAPESYGHRDPFRELYGHPDTMPEALLDEAWDWVRTNIEASTEPF